jgi:hypothetical protein
MSWQQPCFGARGKDESFVDVTAGISMVELEFAIRWGRGAERVEWRRKVTTDANLKY